MNWSDQEPAYPTAIPDPYAGMVVVVLALFSTLVIAASAIALVVLATWPQWFR